MKKISEKVLVDNGYRKCIERVFENHSGVKMDFLVCAKSGNNSGVGVLGLTKEGKFILVDEYRVGPEKVVRSCVVGDVENDGKLEEDAKREFLEETGYTFEKLLPVIELINNPYFVGKTNYYLAIGCSKIQSQDLEEGEEIAIIEFTQKEIEDGIVSGNIDCPYLISLYYTAKAKTKDFNSF